MGNCLEGVQKTSCCGFVRMRRRKRFKVCVCGGTSKVGKPLCLLLAANPRIEELIVQDLAHAVPAPEIIAQDVWMAGENCKVRACTVQPIERPVDHLGECFKGCDLVIICSGWSANERQPSDMLKFNGGLAKSLVEACSVHCPEAIVGLMMPPVNSLLPAVASLYAKAGLNSMKICGITGLDTIRANKLVHIETGRPLEDINIPVVGGYGGKAALPLLSKDKTAAKINSDRQIEICTHIQNGAANVTAAMLGKSGPSLSQAYACSVFAKAVLDGLAGKRTKVCCMLKTKICKGLNYFTAEATFGPTGIEKVHTLGKLSALEQEMLGHITTILSEDIEAGLEYSKNLELSRETSSTSET